MSKYNLLELKFQNSLKYFFKEIGKLENFFTKKVQIKNPTFIFGSPRSGTSLMTEALSKTQYFSSPYQKDLPFCTVPIFWSKFSNAYYGSKKELRVHNQKLILDKNSSDSYEEYIWKVNYDNYLKFFNKVIDDSNIEEIDPKHLKNFMKKIIYLRKKNFYLSKNNINILRIKYLSKAFPDAKFIYCIRNPLDTCMSQMKIHKIFDNIDDKKRVIEYLKILGHYEFSESFEVLRVGKFKEVEQFRNEHMFLESYLLQWNNVNSFALNEYLKNKMLKDKIFIINYNNFYFNEEKFIKNIENFASFLEIPKHEIKKQFDYLLDKKEKNEIYNHISKNLDNAYSTYREITNISQ